MNTGLWTNFIKCCFTRAQMDVIILRRKNKARLDTASSLNVSDANIKFHTRSILKKSGMKKMNEFFNVYGDLVDKLL